jgi:hypothetical protein
MKMKEPLRVPRIRVAVAVVGGDAVREGGHR